MKSAKRIVVESTGLVSFVTLVILIVSTLAIRIHEEYVYATVTGDIKSPLVMFVIITFLVAVLLQFFGSWFVLVRYYRELKKTQMVSKKYLVPAACIASIVPLMVVVNFVILIIGFAVGSF